MKGQRFAQQLTFETKNEPACFIALNILTSKQYIQSCMFCDDIKIFSEVARPDVIWHGQRCTKLVTKQVHQTPAAEFRLSHMHNIAFIKSFSAPLS
jgi:hypothetical protein